MKFWRRQTDQPVDIHRRDDETKSGFRSLFDALAEPIVAITLQNEICVYCNQAFIQGGYTSAEILGKRFGDLGVWACDAPTLSQFLGKLSLQASIRNEAVHLNRGGRAAPHSISASFVNFSGERCALLSLHDFTPTPSVWDATVAASRAKSDFLTDLSHEIRTPLNTILAMADLLSEVRLPDEGRRFVDAMVASGHTLLELVNSVLDLDKIESGRLDLQSAVFDVEEVVDYVAGTVAASAHRKGIEIVGRVMPDVSRRVVGDPLRLRQILLNLVSNAIASTDSGEVVILVEKTGESDPGMHFFRFTVTDTGAGIPQKRVDDLNRSFSESFERRRSRLGTNGLGLSIVKGLLELMDGHMQVQSEVGKGSTFSFVLGFEATEDYEVAEPYSEVDLKGVRVLVVDDSRAKRLKIKELLSSWGAQVVDVDSSESALNEWHETVNVVSPYRLALVDCALVDIDGFELAKSMREASGADQRVIMLLTLDELNAKVARAREVGIIDYIVKPITRSELHSGITHALGLISTIVPSKNLPQAEREIAPRSLHILLVEDSPYNCMVVRAYLKNRPYEIDYAEDGAVGLEKFMRGKYDLVLMDIRMPVMDGYEATRKIREWELQQSRKPTPIVALTAAALEQDIQESMLAGCTAHISKPVKKVLLLETIRDMTESYSDDSLPETGRLPEENASA
jgi:two-component system, sensor histidine kinase and response regulator